MPDPKKNKNAPARATTDTGTGSNVANRRMKKLVKAAAAEGAREATAAQRTATPIMQRQATPRMTQRATPIMTQQATPIMTQRATPRQSAQTTDPFLAGFNSDDVSVASAPRTTNSRSARNKGGNRRQSR